MSPFLEENSVGIKLCLIHKCVRISKTTQQKRSSNNTGRRRRRRRRKRGREKTTTTAESVPKNDERREESGFGGFGGEKKQRLLGLLLGLRFFLSHVFGFRGYVNARERDEELEK